MVDVYVDAAVVGDVGLGIEAILGEGKLVMGVAVGGGRVGRTICGQEVGDLEVLRAAGSVSRSRAAVGKLVFELSASRKEQALTLKLLLLLHRCRLAHHNLGIESAV